MKSPAPIARAIPTDVRQVIVRQLGAALANSWQRRQALTAQIQIAHDQERRHATVKDRRA